MTTDIPLAMQAAQILEKGGQYVLHEVPVPSVGPWDILIETKAAGFCHTDLLVARGDYGKFPITGSHEPAGLIRKLGSEAVALGKFKVGQRIGALNMKGACGKCWDCTKGSDKHCRNYEGLVGLTVDGAFADFTLVDARSAVALPHSMTWDQAAPMMCAGTTCYGALMKIKHLPPGSTIGIMGLGALGHIGAQLAHAMGYVVVAIDSRQPPIDGLNALRLAPHLCINSSKTTAVGALQEISQLDPLKPLRGLDAMLVLTDAHAAFQYAVDLLAPHGTFVLVGQPDEPLAFQYRDIIFKDVHIIGSLIGDTREAQETVDFVAEHKIQVETWTYGLHQLRELVDDARSPDRVGKFVVLF